MNTPAKHLPETFAADDALKLACRCGTVTLQINGAPLAHFYCHCDDCQAAHAAAYVAEIIYPSAAIQVTQGTPQVSAVRSTPRLRCPACGTHLLSEIADGGGLRSVNAYLLPPGVFRPQFHMQCQFAVLPVVDDLPHYRDMPTKFGGSDELVAW